MINLGDRFWPWYVGARLKDNCEKQQTHWALLKNIHYTAYMTLLLLFNIHCHANSCLEPQDCAFNHWQPGWAFRKHSKYLMAHCFWSKKRCWCAGGIELKHCDHTYSWFYYLLNTDCLRMYTNKLLKISSLHWLITTTEANSLFGGLQRQGLLDQISSQFQTKSWIYQLWLTAYAFEHL